MKGRPFTLGKDQPIDGKARVQARCGTRKMWVHPDLHGALGRGELVGYDQNGEKGTWVICNGDDSVVAAELDDTAVEVVPAETEDDAEATGPPDSDGEEMVGAPAGDTPDHEATDSDEVRRDDQDD